MLLRQAAKEFGWSLNYGAIALMWRGGCIIRRYVLSPCVLTHTTNLPHYCDVQCRLTNMNVGLPPLLEKEDSLDLKKKKKEEAYNVSCKTMIQRHIFFGSVREEHKKCNLFFMFR